VRDCHETSGHHLDNRDAKVFFFHRVDGYLGSLEEVEDLLARLVDHKLHRIINAQSLSLSLKLLQNLDIFWASSASNDEEPGVSGQLPEGCLPDSQLEGVIFLWPELCE